MDVKFRVYRRQIPPFSFKNRFRSLLPLQIPPPRSTTSLGACSNSKIYLSQPRTSLQAYVDFKFLHSKSTPTLNNMAGTYLPQHAQTLPLITSVPSDVKYNTCVISGSLRD